MSLETKPDSLIIKWQWLDWNLMLDPWTFSILYPRTFIVLDWKNGFKISNEIQYLGLQAPKCSRLQVLTKRSKRPNAMQNLAYEHKKAKIEYEIFQSVMT